MQSAITALSHLSDDVRLKRLEALVVASESLNRSSGLDETLLTILELMSSQLDCERTTAFLRDQRTGKLHARQMSGSTHLEIVLERGVGIAGYVAECGESVFLSDVRSDPRFDASVDLRTGFVTKTMLCVPLRKPEGTLIGSLQAINARRDQFSEADLAYLESFASLAAVAVEREQLAQEAVRAQLLSTELELARKIQQRLLPAPGLIKLPEPFRAWGTSQACYDVGGDTYDALMIAPDECAFWVADVSGKGIGASLLMSTLQTELRALVRAENDLAALATELNDRVKAVAPMGTYATMFLGVLSVEKQRLRYVNAGHLPAIWINDQRSNDHAFEVGGMPIGLLPGSHYECGATGFEMSERLSVFSDGVTDSENTAGETYDTERLSNSLARIKARDVAEIGAMVFEDLNRFRMGAPAKDDTTFLVVGLS